MKMKREIKGYEAMPSIDSRYCENISVSFYR